MGILVSIITIKLAILRDKSLSSVLRNTYQCLLHSYFALSEVWVPSKANLLNFL